MFSLNIFGHKSHLTYGIGFLVLSVVSSLIVLFISTEVIIDFSPGRIEKWLATGAAFCLFALFMLFLKRPKVVFCWLLPPLLSLNFVLITVGIHAEEYLANNQIGYRPWILIYDFLLIPGLIVSFTNLKASRIGAFIKASFLPIVLFGNFILVGAISLTFANDVRYVWLGLFALIKFLIWFLTFLFIFTSDVKLVQYTTWGMAGFVVFQFLVSVVQVFRIPTVEKYFGWPEDIFIGQGGIIRVGGTVGRAHLESILLLIIPVLFAYANSKIISTRLRKWMIFCGMLGIILVFLTGSRGPMLSTIVGTAVALRVFQFLKPRKMQFRILLVLGLASIVGIIIVLQSGNLANTLLRSTYNFRLETFEVAIRMLEDKPLLGIGLNNYLVVGSNYGLPEYILQFGRPVHNQFLLVGAEMGMIGLTLFMFNLAYWWWLAIRVSRSCRYTNMCWFSYGVQGTLVALFLTSLFDAPLIKPPVINLLAILIAGISALSVYRGKEVAS